MMDDIEQQKEGSSILDKDISRRDFLKMASVLAMIPFFPHKLGLEEREEINIPEELREILEMSSSLEFDQNGDTQFNANRGAFPVPLLRTNYDVSCNPREVEEVLLFVHHFDSAPRIVNGNYVRNAGNTVNGLNREGNPSVHFCIDDGEVSAEPDPQRGFGVLQTQIGSGDVNHPSCGNHICIGYDLATGRRDTKRLDTDDLMATVGVRSNLHDLVQAGDIDFNSYSMGYEQVGCGFSINFPENFPPKQQIANAFSICKLVSNQFGIGPWDNVGHHEIQEKDDPGDEYMALIRLLYGVAALTGDIDRDIVFEGGSPLDYFKKIKNYFVNKSGEERYQRWNSVYQMDTIIQGLVLGGRVIPRKENLLR